VISDLIGQGEKAADDAVLGKAKKTADDFKDLLAGPKRTPIDIEKEKAVFVRGETLSTPGGGPLKVPSKPKPSNEKGPTPVSKVSSGKPIEFISFGRVHRDITTTFPATSANDDIDELDAKVDPGRALYFRAAVEREAIFLHVLADAIGIALADKEKKEGSFGDLMKAAVDLVGGMGGNATAAESADLKPFITKIAAQWDAINVSDIAYGDLHTAAIKLQEVRANLASYLLTQAGKKKDAPPAPAGLLSHLPLIGDVPLPSPIGDIVGTFKKVGGKLHDVSNALIYGLTLAMQPAIESACVDITLDTIKERRPRAYPVWYGSDQLAPKKDEDKKPFSDLKVDDPLGGQLKDIKALRDVDSGVQGFVADRNKNINDAVEKPMEVVDFLSKDVPTAPGNKYLDAAFQAAIPSAAPADGSPPPPPALGGSEKLGEIAVAAFYSACTDDIPDFMKGFVESIFEYVFAVCVEFLRSVYRVLNGLHVTDTVSTEELTAAGSTHILTHLVDFLTSKLGLDELIAHHTVTIPSAPKFLPAGINWPGGDVLSAAPIAAKLKQLLLDKATPYLRPVVDFAMSGLAQRLNDRRAWAGGSALTMEVHLGQLPTELALLFRNLIKPLWDFLDNTCLEVVKDTVAKGMGPAAKAVGLAGDAMGIASSFISDAEQKAKNAQAYAKKIEDKAADLIQKLQSVSVSLSNQQQLGDIGDAAKALKNAITADPLAGGPKSGNGNDPSQDPNAPGVGFPANRKRKGKGKPILDDDLDALKDDEKWPKALDPSKKIGEASDGGAS